MAHANDHIAQVDSVERKNRRTRAQHTVWPSSLLFRWPCSARATKYAVMARGTPLEAGNRARIEDLLTGRPTLGIPRSCHNA